MLPSASNFKLLMVFTARHNLCPRQYYRINSNTSKTSAWRFTEDTCLFYFTNRSGNCFDCHVLILSICGFTNCRSRRDLSAFPNSLDGSTAKQIMRIGTVISVKSYNDGIPRCEFIGRCVRHAYLRSVKIRIIAAFTTLSKQWTEITILNPFTVLHYVFNKLVN